MDVRGVISVTKSSGVVTVPTLTKEQEAEGDCEPKNICLSGLKRFCRLGVANNTTGGSTGLGNIRDLVAALVAEFIGTSMLVGIGCCGALFGVPGPITADTMNVTLSDICARPTTPPAVSSMQVAFVFGLTVAAVIQMFGHISQAHINPSVTLTAIVLGMITWQRALLYFVVQCLGAIFGYGVLKLISPCDLMTSYQGFDPNVGFCTTVPSAGLTIFQVILAEGLATCILIFTVCGAWDQRNANNTDSLALKFGLTLTAIGLAFGPYTGPGMNPARSLGPAVWNNVWTRHWVYWVVPLTAAFLTSAFYRAVMWPADQGSDSDGTSLKPVGGAPDEDDPLTGVRSQDGKADSTRL